MVEVKYKNNESAGETPRVALCFLGLRLKGISFCSNVVWEVANELVGPSVLLLLLLLLYDSTEAPQLRNEL